MMLVKLRRDIETTFEYPTGKHNPFTCHTGDIGFAEPIGDGQYLIHMHHFLAKPICKPGDFEIVPYEEVVGKVEDYSIDGWNLAPYEGKKVRLRIEIIEEE